MSHLGYGGIEKARHVAEMGLPSAMKNAPPQGFLDFVVARGATLHRTAALLAGQGQAAADLSQIALARAWQSWSRIDGNHDAHVRRIMVNAFTRHPVTAAVDTTSPVQRAVVVLRFFHDYTEVATAEAMNLTIAAVRSQTLDALASLRISEERLRGELREEADGTAHPDVEALMAGAQQARCRLPATPAQGTRRNSPRGSWWPAGSWPPPRAQRTRWCRHLRSPAPSPSTHWAPASRHTPRA